VSATAPEPRSRTEQFVLALRRMPLVRQLVPQEAGIGWPLPRRRDGRLFVLWPFYGFAPDRSTGRTNLFPIFATLTIDWATKVPVEYVDLVYSGLCPRQEAPVPVGQFPHPAVAKMTVAQYQEAKARLLALYDQLFDTLAASGTFTPEFAREFGDLFVRLLEPSLESQYRELGGPFVTHFLGEKKPG
jgi:hypothetical protein